MNFAIIGASGNVGRKTIEILEKSKISFQELFLVASEKSAGKKIKFREKEVEIENIKNYDFCCRKQSRKRMGPESCKKNYCD
jgi:aspartate-semialdehyde dehydrogenase